jgi:hypothetical protein
MTRFLHSSLLKIWDFFYSCEKFYVFSLFPLRSTREKTEFLTLVNVVDVFGKGRSPSNGKLSDFSFYIDSQKSVHRKFKK